MDPIEQIIELALSEDIGPGDITTIQCIKPETTGFGIIAAKESLLLAGVDVACRVFRKLDPAMKIEILVKDGYQASEGQTLLTLKGNLRALLSAERTALNFLQRLSGIASMTSDYVSRLGMDAPQLVDTRKTVPGWRVLDKYAVRIGGGNNHRMGLYDGILIKDNHIAACGSLSKAVSHIRAAAPHLLKIEVEAATLDEVYEALSCGVDVIMLDNMDVGMIAKAVTLIQNRALVEISGGIGKENLVDLARTGADFISIGAITHSARCMDISMYIK